MADKEELQSHTHGGGRVVCNNDGNRGAHWSPYFSKVAAWILVHSLGSKAVLMLTWGRRLDGMASKVRGDKSGRHATCAAVYMLDHWDGMGVKNVDLGRG